MYELKWDPKETSSVYTGTLWFYYRILNTSNQWE